MVFPLPGVRRITTGRPRRGRNGSGGSLTMHRRASLGLAVLLAGVVGLQATCRGGMDALPDNRLGVRTAPLLLLSRPDVQADLKLSRTQIDDAAEAIRRLQAQAATLRGMTGKKALEARAAIDG